MRLYIAGKMTGEPEYNYPAFHAAAQQWRLYGWDVMNPAARFSGQTDLPYEVYINHSLLDVICSDAIAVIAGWEESGGAALEVQYARTVGKPVYRAEYPDRSGGSGLRPETGGVRAPYRELREDGAIVVGVSGGACACGGDGCRCGADDGATEDGSADGVARTSGLDSGYGRVHSDIQPGDAGRQLTSGMTDFMAWVCRRCMRPMNEHEPFALPSEWGSCEEFIR